MTSQTWNLTERPGDPFRSTEPVNFKMRDEVRRLLEVSTRSVNSDSPLVSPEGLGCSGLSFGSVRKPVGQTSEKTLYHSDTAAGRLGSCLRPEDDILYQWRLRRKLEQSGLKVQSGLQPSDHLGSHCGLKVQSGLQPSDHLGSHCGLLQLEQSGIKVQSGLQPSDHLGSHCGIKVQSGLQPSDHLGSHCGLLQQAQKTLMTRDLLSAVSEARAQEPPFPHPTVSQVPPKHHTSPQTPHFRGVLPGPPQSPAQGCPPDSRLQERRNSPGPCTCSQVTEQQTRNTSDNQLNKVHSVPNEHLPKNKEGHSLSAQKSGKERKSAASQQEGAAADDISKRRNGTSSSRTKTSRHAKHGNHTAQSGPALGRVDREHKSQKQQIEPRHERPHSPLHTALGMVVSEVLFPDSPSADSPTSVTNTESGEDSHPFLPETSSTPHHLQRPSEIITLLLQEAHNSDESEFEDDPLLLVLREQRRSVKQRICEIDMLLDTWEETQP